MPASDTETETKLMTPTQPFPSDIDRLALTASHSISDFDSDVPISGNRLASPRSNISPPKRAKNVIGQGASATVYRTENGRALKVVTFRKPGDRERFHQEVIYAQLASEWKVGPEVYAAGFEAKRGLLEMKQYDRTLLSWVREHPTSEAWARLLRTKFLTLIKHGVVCLDLKPQNVIVSGESRITDLRLIDFGHHWCSASTAKRDLLIMEMTFYFNGLYFLGPLIKPWRNLIRGVVKRLTHTELNNLVKALNDKSTIRHYYGKAVTADDVRAHFE